MEQPLIVFVRYDTYPYLLSGVLEEVTNDGGVKLKNYGSGAFPSKQIIAILPEGVGVEYKKVLENLSSEYSHAKTRLRKEYVEKLRQAVPNIPIDKIWPMDGANTVKGLDRS